MYVRRATASVEQYDRWKVAGAVAFSCGFFPFEICSKIGDNPYSISRVKLQP